MLSDPQLTAVAAFKAETTPEAFVLDANFVLRYRGRIDNGYAARLKCNSQTTEHDLKRAIDEVLAGKDVSVPATRPSAVHLSARRSRPGPARSLTTAMSCRSCKTAASNAIDRARSGRSS